MRVLVTSLMILALAGTARAQGGGGMPGGGGPADGGGGWGAGGRHGGRGGPDGGGDRMRPPPMKPVKRARFDAAVTALFQELDVDHDGIATTAEVTVALQARRDTAIRDRFARIDSNHDKVIDAGEFMAWQRSLGDAAALDDHADGQHPDAMGDGIGAAQDDDKLTDRLIARLIGQVDAVAIAQANTNYDKGASLAELLAYEGGKFDALDTDHDGTLDEAELRAGKLMGGRGGGFGGRRGGGPADGAPGAPPLGDGD